MPKTHEVIVVRENERRIDPKATAWQSREFREVMLGEEYWEQVSLKYARNENSGGKQRDAGKRGP